MKKFLITISAPDFYTVDQAENFMLEATQSENIARDNCILISVEKSVELSQAYKDKIKLGILEL